MPLLMNSGAGSARRRSAHVPARWSAPTFLVWQLGELAGVLKASQGKPRTALNKIEISRPVPWQQAIIDNPQQRLQKSGQLDKLLYRSEMEA
jgi:hypothetical protein